MKEREREVMWYLLTEFCLHGHWLQIAAICQEAGMQAVRKNRYVILPKDFEKGYRSNVKKSDTDFEFYR
jgi:ATP-dependent 26S proteasome regulatory subunit